MALSKLNFNSLNLTPVAGKGIGFDSGADDLEASFSGGSMVFIKKLTADGSTSTFSFVNGSSDVVLDSTYKEYVIIINGHHPASDSVDLRMEGSVNGGSSYGVTATTTSFRSAANEANNDTDLVYRTGTDQAQATTGIYIMSGTATGNDNDQCTCVKIHLFNPSSTTFVKHFIAESSGYTDDDRNLHGFSAGYFNTTSAVNAIKFTSSSGNIDAGTITLYGIN